MKSIQDYINTYKQIAKNLEITGDSAEILVQLLSQWSYLNEMELVNYVMESSIETAILTNSKIQHCVDRMYSVFRGSCPRVKLRFIPHKYLNFKDYDLVYSSSRVNLYYHGDPITIAPSTKLDEYVEIDCILAKVVKTATKTFVDSNRYYVDFLESNLSNDGYITINGEVIPMYRKFSDHIKYGGAFDLTLPDYGMRVYAPDVFRTSNEVDSMNEGEHLVEPNTKVEINMFEFCTLEDFSNLDKIRIDGTEMPTKDNQLDSETYPGITLYKEVPRDTMISTHYKANRDRYVNSIMRSNLDVCSMLEEYLPNKIIKGGAVYEFTKEGEGDDAKVKLMIYYIPYDNDNLVTTDDVDNFCRDNKSYYVTEDIQVIKGDECKVRFDVNVELYKNYRIDDEVKPILLQYEDKFNIDLESKIGEIESAISKISNVRSILRLKHDDGTITSGIQFKEIDQDGNKIDYIPYKTKYCKIEFNINSTVYRRSVS